jgi:hypothetical protein
MKPTPELTQLTTAFQVIHTGIKGDALALKLKMFFGGLLVNELTEWHRENIGETRGRPGAEEINPTVGFISVQAWLEEQIGVTRSTAHRYRSFWRSISESTVHAGAVKALNAWWLEHKPALALPAPEKGKAKKDALATTATAQQMLNMQSCSNLLAEDLQSLLEEADELGLHELFEKPTKDVTPEVIEKLEEGQKDKQLELALQFWGPQGQIIKRLNRKDYLHLPKREKEALVSTLEEALEELKDTLRARR